MTEKDVLNEFETFGWKVIRNDNICMVLKRYEVVLTISKLTKIYHCCLPTANDYRWAIDMYDHYLLHKLFKIWGWLLDEKED